VETIAPPSIHELVTVRRPRHRHDGKQGVVVGEAYGGYLAVCVEGRGVVYVTEDQIERSGS